MDNQRTFEPGRLLTLEEMQGHPFCRWLQDERHLAVTPEYVGAGHYDLFGMKVAMHHSDIVFMMTHRDELYVIAFERRGARSGLVSPLADMQCFLTWGAYLGEEYHVQCGIAKVKQQRRPGCLEQPRLFEAYQRLFHGTVLGYDEHNFPWIGRSAKSLREDPHYPIWLAKYL